MDDSKICINISRAEALVLFEWLASEKISQKEAPDRAEEMVLLKIEGQLESMLVEIVKSNYQILLQAAKLEILRKNES